MDVNEAMKTADYWSKGNKKPVDTLSRLVDSLGVDTSSYMDRQRVDGSYDSRLNEPGLVDVSGMISSPVVSKLARSIAGTKEAVEVGKYIAANKDGENAMNLIGKDLQNQLKIKEAARGVRKDYRVPGEMRDNSDVATIVAIADNLMQDPRFYGLAGVAQGSYRYLNEKE